MVDVLALLLFDLCFLCCLNEFLKSIFFSCREAAGQESLRVFVTRFYLLVVFLWILMIFMGRGLFDIPLVVMKRPKLQVCPPPLALRSQCTPSILTCS